jgi:hypothetical protein
MTSWPEIGGRGGVLGMECRVEISDSLSRTRLFPALLEVMERDTGVVVGTSLAPGRYISHTVFQRYALSNLHGFISRCKPRIIPHNI